jgi:hypothetical protein
MSAKIPFRRGDNFLVEGSVSTQSGPQDLTDWSIRSQVKDGATLIAELDVVYPYTLDQGRYQLQCIDTHLWPTKTLHMDIRYTNSLNQLMSSEIISITVRAGITD